MTPAPDPIQKRWKALVRKLRPDPPAPSNSADLPPAPLTIISAAVHGTLLWEASFSQARLAYQHLTQHFADYNDMRVALPSQLIMSIGDRYPLAAERCVRLKTWLGDLYRRSNSLDLEHLRDVTRAEARHRLLSLQGLPDFAAAFAAMTSLGEHAFPVDTRLLRLLIDEKIVEASTTTAEAMTRLESLVSHDELPETYAILRAWSDRDGSPPKREETDAFRSLELAPAPLAPAHQGHGRKADAAPLQSRTKSAAKPAARKTKPRPKAK